MTVHHVVFVRVQRVQKVTEIVGRNVGRCREWEGRRVGGQTVTERHVGFARVQRVQKLRKH